MRYKYWFNNEVVEIEVDDEWAEALREMDRQERNSNILASHKNIHYDAFGFEPDFMGKEEPEIAARFDSSPAFEYAVRQIPPREMEILRRRALTGEPYSSIAESYGMSATGVRDIYCAYSARFSKYYEDGRWIYSSNNTPLPGNGKVRRITERLTPEQVQEIRGLRFEFHTLTEISDRLGIPCNRVLMCLMENPVDVTFCPTCGKPIQQTYRKKMQVFCSHKCYARNYLKTGADEESKIARVKVRVFPNRNQQRILQFYKQAFMPYTRMSEMLGMPFRTVQTFFRAKPLPCYACIECGRIITGAADTNRIHRFCSKKCRRQYRETHPGAERFVNEDFYPGGILPTPETLYLAMEMKALGHPADVVSACAGLNARELEALFRYDSAEETPPEGDPVPAFIPKVVTRPVRMVNAHIWEPRTIADSTPLYTATFLIPKDDRDTIEGIKSALELALKNGKRKDGNTFYNSDRASLPLRDGDSEQPDPAFQNCHYINAASLFQPEIVDRKLYPVTDRAALGVGCLVRASITFFPYWINQKRYGIGCRLGTLQLVESGREEEEIADICSEAFEADCRLIYFSGDGPG